VEVLFCSVFSSVDDGFGSPASRGIRRASRPTIAARTARTRFGGRLELSSAMGHFLTSGPRPSGTRRDPRARGSWGGRPRGLLMLERNGWEGPFRLPCDEPG